MSLDARSDEDRALVSDYCEFWVSRPFEEMAGVIPWAKFLDHSQFERCLQNALEHAGPSASSDAILEALCSVLADPSSSEILSSVRPQIPALISAAERITGQSETHSQHLTEALERIIKSSLPLGIDRAEFGTGLVDEWDDVALSELSRSGEMRWSTRLESLSTLPASADTLSTSSLRGDMASVLAYHSQQGMDALSTPVATAGSSSDAPPSFAGLAVSADLSACLDVDNGPELGSSITALFDAASSRSSPKQTRLLASNALLDIIRRSPSAIDPCIPHIVSVISSLSFRRLFRPTFMAFLYRLASGLPSIATSVIDRGLQLAVRQFAEQPEDSRSSLRALEIFCKLWRLTCMVCFVCMFKPPHLASLIERTGDAKVHLVEPVFTAAIGKRLGSAPVIQFLAAVAKCVKLKVCDVLFHINQTLFDLRF